MTHNTHPPTTARKIVVLEQLTIKALNGRRYYAAYLCVEYICDNIDTLDIEVEEFNARMELVGSD